MELSPVQKILLQMMSEFDSFCKENNIDYYMAGGTLLGAVREKGFIKWDDDIDVMMDRENYEKFINIALSSNNDKYFFQCVENDPLWHYHYTKIRLNGTVYATKFSNQFDGMHQGVFVDVFVQDNTADNRLMQKLHVLQIRFWRGLLRYKWINDLKCSDDNKIKKLICILTFFISLEKAKNKTLKSMKRYNKINSNYLIDGCGMHLKQGAYPKIFLGEPTYLKFESLVLPAPANCHEYLSYLYGKDYLMPKKYGHIIEDIKL